MNLRSTIMLCVTFCLTSCSSSNYDGLEGTIWLNENLDNCASRIGFQDSLCFYHYYCGVDETNFGYYYIKDDTLILDEYVIAEVPIFHQKQDSSLRFKYKCIIEGDTLKLVKYFDLGYNYVEDIKDKEINYIKMKG